MKNFFLLAMPFLLLSATSVEAAKKKRKFKIKAAETSAVVEKPATTEKPAVAAKA